MRRTFIKSHDDVRIQIPLDLHRTLRTDERGSAVEVVLKMHPLFGNLPQLGQREHLKTPAVSEYRPLPSHEFVQSALPGDQLLSGPDMEVIGIAENDLCPELLELEQATQP